MSHDAIGNAIGLGIAVARLGTTITNRLKCIIFVIILTSSVPLLLIILWKTRQFGDRPIITTTKAESHILTRAWEK